MPPTVTASRGHSESSDDQSSDGECPSRLPEAETLGDDDCVTTSCDSKYSDDSSQDPSTSSTPQHSAASIPAAKAEKCQLSCSNLHEENDAQQTSSRFFKFKRKYRILIYLFLKKLRMHLIMCLKFVLSLLLVLATVQFSFPESVRPTISHQFFPSHTLVTDFYEGELQLLAEKLQHTDLALVMYYAPWDRESQLARTQFAQAARILHDQVFFCAINCWQPQSFCRMNHKVTSYPAFVLHVNTGALKGSVTRESRAFPYNGPVLAEHIVRFVTAGLRPYQLVSDRRHLASLQLTHSALMLTYIHGGLEAEYTDPSTAAVVHSQRQLAFWYRAALHWLDYDKRAEVTWAVITNPSLATQLGLINSTAEHVTRPTAGLPPIRMLIADVNYEFNATLPNWREPKPLLEWVMAQLADTVGWLEVTGAKSSVLNSLLRRGPTLLVFTPDQPQHQHNVLFDVVRGLWLHYSTCAPLNMSVGDTRAGRMANFLLDSHKRYAASVGIAAAQCAVQRVSNNFGISEGLASDAAEDCSLPLSSEAADVRTEGCEEDHFTCHPFMPFFAKPGSGVGELVWSLVGDACQSLFGFSTPASEHASLPCPARYHRPPSNATSAPQRLHSAHCVNKSGGMEDERVQDLLLWHGLEECRRLQSSEVLPLGPPPPAPSQALLEALAGGACESNRTLQFGVLDSKLHADLGARWGLNWTQLTQGSGAVLVDLRREAHYVLREPVSAASLTAFLVNFTLGLLDRVELSKAPVSRYVSDYEDLDYVHESVLASLRQYSESARPVDPGQLQQTDSSVHEDQPDAVTGKTDFESYVSFHEELNEIYDGNKQEQMKPAQSKESKNNEKQKGASVKKVVENSPRIKNELASDARETGSDDERDGKSWELSIIELSADTYWNFTHTPAQAVVVLHYSRSCVFCTSLSHALLTTASHFAQLAAQSGSWQGIAFARIDMSANTLPWGLNFPRLPTLVYYPPHRKSNTEVLDARTPLTVGNMMRFVAAQLSPALRARLAMAGCKSACVAALSARLPASNSHVQSQLRRVSARLRRVTEAMLQLQPETPLSDVSTAPGSTEGDGMHKKDSLISSASSSNSGTIPSKSSESSSTPNASSSTTPNASSSTTPNASSSTTPNASSSTTPNASSSTTPNASSSTTPNASSSTTPNASSSTPNASSSKRPEESQLTEGPVDGEVRTSFDSSNASKPLSRYEILQLGRSSLTAELSSLRSQAQYLNLLQKIIIARRSALNNNEAHNSSIPFDAFLPFL